jgi:hypothetical protein
VVVVGNKSDIADRQVSEKQAKSWTQKHPGFQYI